MPKSTNLCHSVTAAIAVPKETAMGFFKDPAKLGDWTLGTTDIQTTSSADVVEGRSRFDGSRSLLRIDCNADYGVVDYYIGTRPDRLNMRISVRVLDGESFGMGTDYCLATLLAWRPVGMDKARWHRLCASHEAEILLAKAQLEEVNGTVDY